MSRRENFHYDGVGVLDLPKDCRQVIPMPLGEDPAYPTRACPGSIDKIGVLQHRLAAGLPLFLAGDRDSLDAEQFLRQRIRKQGLETRDSNAEEWD